MTQPRSAARRVSTRLQDGFSTLRSMTIPTGRRCMRRSFSGMLRRLSSHWKPGCDATNRKNLKLTLDELPEDILLEIAYSLDARSLLKVEKVCHGLHDLINTYAVWHFQATLLMTVGRPLVLPGFSTLNDLSLQELKIAVLRTVKLAEKWSSDLHYPPSNNGQSSGSLTSRVTSFEGREIDGVKPLRALCSEKTSLSVPVPQCLCYIVKFKHFLLPPTRDGRLIGWNIEAKREIGTYDMARGIHGTSEETLNNDAGNTELTRNRAIGLIFSGRVHYSARSLYYIVSAGFVSGQEMQFYILHIKFPSKDDTGGPIQYTRVAALTMPYAYIIEMHILDVSRRMLCMALLCPSSKTLCLYIVFDWDTKEAAIVNTGLKYQYRKTVISLRLSSNGDNVILRSEQGGRESQRIYSLSSLSPKPQPQFLGSQSLTLINTHSPTTSPFVNMLLSSHPVTPPLHESQVTWSDDATCSSSPPFPNPNFPGWNALAQPVIFAYRVWNMLPWWPTFNNVPYRTSTVVLYWTPHPGPGEYRWKIAQHFATDNGPCPIPDTVAGSVQSQPSLSFASEPSSSSRKSSTSILRETGPTSTTYTNTVKRQAVYKRCIVPLRDPVMVPNSEESVPVLGLAYNHVAWIEQVHSRRRGRRSKKRVAMLASFPDPGCISSSQLALDCNAGSGGSGEKHQGLRANVQVLDIPERVLDRTYHLIVDSSSATVSITTRENELHTYRYA